MHKNVVATSGEGEKEFNFNQWLINNDLTTLKPLFLKYGATSMPSLRITSPEMQRLMVDMEFLSKPQMVPKVVTATHQLEAQREVMKVKTVILSEKEQAVIDDIKQKLDTVDTMEAEVIGLQSDYPESQQRIRNMKRVKIERATAKINETFNALIQSLLRRKQLLLNLLRTLNDCDDVNGDDDEKKENGTDELTKCSQNIGDLRQFLKQKEREYNDSVSTKMSKEERRRAILKIGCDVSNRFGIKQSEIEDTMDMMKRRVTANNEVKIDIEFMPNGCDQMRNCDIRTLGTVTAGATGPLNSVYAAGKANGGTFHRVYFLDRVLLSHLSCHTNPVYIKFNKILPSSMFRMNRVANDNEHFMYLDIAIPWEKLKLPASLSVSFHYKLNEKWSQITTTSKVNKEERGFYYLPQWAIDAKSLKEANRAIVAHLMESIVDTASYLYSRDVLNSNEVNQHRGCGNCRELWETQLLAIDAERSLASVHRLQFLKSINYKFPELSVYSLFSIVRGCVAGNTFCSEYNRQSIGVAIYKLFGDDLRRIANSNSSDDSNRHRISNRDRIYLFPVFNFFRFFQDVDCGMQGGRWLWDGQVFSCYELERVKWNKDKKWMETNLLDILRVDLRIGEFNKKRKYPMEKLILKSKIDRSLAAQVSALLREQ